MIHELARKRQGLDPTKFQRSRRPTDVTRPPSDALRRRAAPAGLALVRALGLGPAAAAGHPLGMSSVNRYAGVRLHVDAVELDYLLDFAELPAWREIETLDADHDERVTPAERDRYLAQVVAQVRAAAAVTVDGAATTLALAGQSLDAPPGQNGLSTLRVALEFRAPLPVARGRAITMVRIRDTLFAGRDGWRELGALPSDTATLRSSSLPAAAVRAGPALAYPADPGGRSAGRPPPLRQDDATFVFERHPSTGAAPGPDATGRAPASEGDPSGRRLAALLRSVDRSWGFALFALALAFGLGAGHALSPGHGKTLVAAWMVGDRGRPRDAVALGFTMAATHTLSVFVLGLFALPLEAAIGSDKLLRTLELVAGTLVVGLALAQLPARWRRWRAGPSVAEVAGPAPSAPPTTRSIVAMGVSGGIVPCPGALVVLLTAVALHRVSFGLALLVAFSLGLASVLTVIGLGVAYAHRRVARDLRAPRLLLAAPLVSSALVLSLGALLVARALAR
jgi:ABC-type nickel/cobalt efflux system permease component RcnA